MNLSHNIEPVSEVDGKLLCRLPPVRQRHGPFLPDVSIRKIYQFENGIVIWENALGLGHFAHLTVVAFNDIRCVYNTAYVCRIGEVLAQSIPLVTP